MTMTKHEIIDEVYYEKAREDYLDYIWECCGKTPSEVDYEKVFDKAEEKFNNIRFDDGSTGGDYTLDDEFIVDDIGYPSKFIPEDRWEEFVEYDTVVAYLKEFEVTNDFYEWLGLDICLKFGKDINYSHDEIFKNMKSFIAEDLNNYFNYAFDYEGEDK